MERFSVAHNGTLAEARLAYTLATHFPLVNISMKLYLPVPLLTSPPCCLRWRRMPSRLHYTKSTALADWCYVRSIKEPSLMLFVKLILWPYGIPRSASHKVIYQPGEQYGRPYLCWASPSSNNSYKLPSSKNTVTQSKSCRAKLCWFLSNYYIIFHPFYAKIFQLGVNKK